LYLLCWDLSTYGTWIVLSAVSSYLSMADFGMVYTAGNRMTMAIARSQPGFSERAIVHDDGVRLSDGSSEAAGSY
jgi:hypothetical protein